MRANVLTHLLIEGSMFGASTGRRPRKGREAWLDKDGQNSLLNGGFGRPFEQPLNWPTSIWALNKPVVVGQYRTESGSGYFGYFRLLLEPEPNKYF